MRKIVGKISLREERLFLLCTILLLVQVGFAETRRVIGNSHKNYFTELEKSSESSEQEYYNEYPGSDEEYYNEADNKGPDNHQGRSLLSAIGDGIHSFQNSLYGPTYCEMDKKYYFYDDYNNPCRGFKLWTPIVPKYQ